MDTGGQGGEGWIYGESNMETYITICKIYSQWEFAVWPRKLKQGLYINLEGWDGEGGGWEITTYVYLWLIHVDVWQKPTQFCKAIILQWKNKIKNKVKKNSPQKNNKKRNYLLLSEFEHRTSSRRHSDTWEIHHYFSSSMPSTYIYIKVSCSSIAFWKLNLFIYVLTYLAYSLEYSKWTTSYKNVGIMWLIFQNFQGSRYIFSISCSLS